MALKEQAQPAIFRPLVVEFRLPPPQSSQALRGRHPACETPAPMSSATQAVIGIVSEFSIIFKDLRASPSRRSGLHPAFLTFGRAQVHESLRCGSRTTAVPFSGRYTHRVSAAKLCRMCGRISAELWSGSDQRSANGCRQTSSTPGKIQMGALDPSAEYGVCLTAVLGASGNRRQVRAGM